MHGGNGVWCSCISFRIIWIERLLIRKCYTSPNTSLNSQLFDNVYYFILLPFEALHKWQLIFVNLYRFFVLCGQTKIVYRCYYNFSRDQKLKSFFMGHCSFTCFYFNLKFNARRLYTLCLHEVLTYKYIDYFKNFIILKLYPRIQKYGSGRKCRTRNSCLKLVRLFIENSMQTIVWYIFLIKTFYYSQLRSANIKDLERLPANGNLFSGNVFKQQISISIDFHC